MNDLKTDIKKIYDFVNAEFDIEDKEQIEAIKESLELEKIEALDIMLKDYNKQVVRLKRAEQLRQNAKKYKKVGTNLKLVDYEKFEQKAMLEEITISELTKKALYAYIAPKTVSSEEIDLRNDLKALNQRYEALNAENEMLKADKSTLEKKVKDLEDLKHKNSGVIERLTNAWETKKEELAKANEKVEYFEGLSVIGKIINIFKR
jgi:DNA repair exonuclease SbcCD ATPase subunit